MAASAVQTTASTYAINNSFPVSTHASYKFSGVPTNPKFKKINLAIPLEITYGMYREYDVDQIKILENGGLDLILIENASGMLLNWLNTKRKMELLILRLIKEAKEEANISVLPSATFKEYHLKEDITRYKNLMPLNVFGGSGDKYITSYSIDLAKPGDESVGHYGAFIYTKSTKKLVIFDSMGSYSVYVKLFTQIGREIFDVANNNISVFKFCPQPTGGFSGNPPPQVAGTPSYTRSKKEVKELINLQHVNSQDHFCSAWTLWYFSRILFSTPIELQNEIKITKTGESLLGMIKTFIYGLVLMLDKVPHFADNAFFKAHFLSYWSGTQLTHFQRMRILPDYKDFPHKIVFTTEKERTYYDYYNKPFFSKDYAPYLKKYDPKEIVNNADSSVWQPRGPWDAASKLSYEKLDPIILLKSVFQQTSPVREVLVRDTDIFKDFMKSYYIFVTDLKSISMDQLTTMYTYLTKQSAQGITQIDLTKDIKDVLSYYTTDPKSSCLRLSAISTTNLLSSTKCYTSLHKKLTASFAAKQKIFSFESYQSAITEHLRRNRGILLFHSTGAGKTISSILAAVCLNALFPTSYIYIVTPSSTVDQFTVDTQKYIDNYNSRVKVFTHTDFVNNFERYECKNIILIIDEAQNFRSKIQTDVNVVTAGKKASKMIACAKAACRVILLSATPLVNEPYDIENLIAMIDGREPVDKRTFNKYTDQEYDALFKCKISIYDRKKGDKRYPDLDVKDIRIPMDSTTYDHYRRLETMQSRERSLYNIDPEIFWNNPKTFYLGFRKMVDVLTETKLQAVVDILLKHRQNCEILKKDYKNNRKIRRIEDERKIRSNTLSKPDRIIIQKRLNEDAAAELFNCRAVIYSSYAGEFLKKIQNRLTDAGFTSAIIEGSVESKTKVKPCMGNTPCLSVSAAPSCTTCSSNINRQRKLQTFMTQKKQYVRKTSKKITVPAVKMVTMTRGEIRNAYNKGLIDVLIITKAGAEGIDLKQVNSIIIHDPVWNKATENQIIGRGVRNLSHDDLPLSMRTVDAYRLIATKPKIKQPGDRTDSVDEILYVLLEKKTKKLHDFVQDHILKNTIEYIKC